MKIVIGHKNLNLEELFQVSCQANIAEVVVDSVTAADFSAATPHKDPQVPPALALELTQEQARAVILVKLLQIAKLKKNATRPTIDFLVGLLNANKPLVGESLFGIVFALAKEASVAFSEKELFILGNSAHTFNALFALELSRLNGSLPLLDTTLALSLEALQTHPDLFTDYALTLGKTSQGTTNFKNNIQALTDKSKLFGTTRPDARVYQLQAGLHERVLQLQQTAANEMNTDYGSLFSEKKYKELLAFAREQQAEQVEVFNLQLKQLVYLTRELAQLSGQRAKLLGGSSVVEEAKVEAGDITQTFKALASRTLQESYLFELYACFTKSRAQEAELKAKAAA